MFHFWKSAGEYAKRATVVDLSLLKICLMALGMVIGVTVPRRKNYRQVFWQRVYLLLLYCL